MQWPFGSNQLSLRRAVTFDGYGVHSAKPVSMRILPAEVGRGLVFSPTWRPGFTLSVLPQHLQVQGYCTQLVKDDVAISTVEHFLSAALALGLVNATVEISAGELPILDGSSWPYVEQLRPLLMDQRRTRPYYRLTKSLCLQEENMCFEAQPADDLQVHYSLDYEHPFFNETRANRLLKLTTDSYCQSLAKARTYGFIKQLPALQKMGLAQGASLENTLALDDHGAVNPEGLRHEQECVDHKILDFLGDLAVLGRPVLGHFRIHRGGHAWHAKVLQTMLAEGCLVSAQPVWPE